MKRILLGGMMAIQMSIANATDATWEFSSGEIAGVKDYYDTVLTIPVEVNEKPVEKIGRGAFTQTAYKQVIIPQGVQVIGEYAFRDCKQLEHVSLPKGLKAISADAFYNCEALRSIDIPDGVEMIGDRAFGQCRNLREVTIGEGVKRVSDMMFSSCKILRRISIPSGVTEIGSSAFESCDNLSEVNIPEGLKVIKRKAFYGCKNIGAICLPNSLFEIEDCAFESCNALAKVKIPKGVQRMGRDVFSADTIVEWIGHEQENIQERMYFKTFLGINFTGKEIVDENYDKTSQIGVVAKKGKRGTLTRQSPQHGYYKLKKKFRYIDAYKPDKITKMGNIEKCSFTGVIARPEGMDNDSFERFCRNEGATVASLIEKKYGIKFSADKGGPFDYYTFKNDNMSIQFFPQTRHSSNPMMLIMFENHKIRRDDWAAYESQKKQKEAKAAAAAKQLSDSEGLDVL